MLQQRTFSGDDFVREYGGKVCVMPGPNVTVAAVVWVTDEPWSRAGERMAAHLKAGITLVLLVSERHRGIDVFRDDTVPKRFEANDTLTIPDVLPGFAVPVASLFA